MTYENNSEFARQITNAVSQAFREELTRQAERMQSDRAAFVEAAREEARENNARAATQLDEFVTEALQRIDAQATNASNETVRKFSEGAQIVSNRAVDAITKAATDAEAKMKAAGETLADLIDKANTASRTAQVEASKAAAAQAAATEAQAKADKSKAEAEKALQFLTMRGDVEVEQMTAKVEFEARAKRVMKELEGEREELENSFDNKINAIERGLSEVYPKLRERLDKAAAQEAEGKDTSNG